MKRDDFLKHVAWTGTGIAWSLSSSGLFNAQRALAAGSGISFVQISDSHIGFSHPENPDVAGTLSTDHRRDQRDARATDLRRPYRRRHPSF